jgi:hypothetical protein
MLRFWWGMALGVILVGVAAAMIGESRADRAQAQDIFRAQLAECQRMNGTLSLRPYRHGGAEWEVERCIIGVGWAPP